MLPVARLSEVFKRTKPQAAVLAISGSEARTIAAALVRLGIRAILNMSGELLVLPDTVKTVNLDPVGELLELCYYCSK